MKKLENDYYIQLIRSKPITVDKLKIYPVSFGDMCDNIGLENIDLILQPFCITKECFNLHDDELQKMNLFEDLILAEKSLCVSMIIGLQLFCKTNKIYLKGKSVFIETPDIFFELNKNNFEKISEIIRKITASDKLKPEEKPPKNLTPRQLDIWTKLHEGRKREEKKNVVHIYDILNVCEFGGNYHIPIEEIESWSLWKIMNCYRAIKNLKTYDDNLKICLVTGDGKSISGDNHWHRQLMVSE